MDNREFRLKALEIARGDFDLAEKYIAWANLGNDDAETYLSTEGVTPTLKNRFIEKYIINKEPFPGENELSDLLYSDFLRTRYWKIVARYVKRRANGKCEKCGSTEKLHVHHKTYENHGDEARHLDDLECLCEKCHTKEHYINAINAQKKQPTTAIGKLLKLMEPGKVYRHNELVSLLAPHGFAKSTVTNAIASGLKYGEIGEVPLVEQGMKKATAEKAVYRSAKRGYIIKAKDGTYSLPQTDEPPLFELIGTTP